MQIRTRRSSIRDCTFFATSFVPLVDMHASSSRGGLVPTAHALCYHHHYSHLNHQIDQEKVRTYVKKTQRSIVLLPFTIRELVLINNGW